MKSFLSLILTFSLFSAIAQEDSLLSGLDQAQPKEKVYTTSTFKGSRLINNYTSETLGKKNLEFRVGHRFGDVGGGEETFWGLDNANMNITLDYGITQNLTIGIGRHSFEKMYEGVAKYRLLRQTDGNEMPITMTVLGKANILSNTKGAAYDDPINAWSYVAELIFARKFNKHFSLMISPTYIHINLVPTEFTSNDIFALSLGARYKITRSVAITGEYSHVLNDYYDKQLASFIPVASIGVDLETGGHVFQLFLTNGNSLNEVQFIPSTTSDWGREEFRFGFNISRIFGNSGKR